MDAIRSNEMNFELAILLMELYIVNVYEFTRSDVVATVNILPHEIVFNETKNFCHVWDMKTTTLKIVSVSVPSEKSMGDGVTCGIDS